MSSLVLMKYLVLSMMMMMMMVVVVVVMVKLLEVVVVVRSISTYLVAVGDGHDETDEQFGALPHGGDRVLRALYRRSESGWMDGRDRRRWVDLSHFSDARGTYLKLFVSRGRQLVQFGHDHALDDTLGDVDVYVLGCGLVGFGGRRRGGAWRWGEGSQAKREKVGGRWEDVAGEEGEREREPEEEIDVPFSMARVYDTLSASAVDGGLSKGARRSIGGFREWGREKK